MPTSRRVFAHRDDAGLRPRRRDVPPPREHEPGRHLRAVGGDRERVPLGGQRLQRVARSHRRAGASSYVSRSHSARTHTGVTRELSRSWSPGQPILPSSAAWCRRLGPNTTFETACLLVSEPSPAVKPT